MNECLKTGGKPSICFVAPQNFAALMDDPKFGNIGGAEIQQSIIGGELAKRGYRVSFVILDHGQDNKMEIDGMRIIKAYDQNAGIRVLRFLHPRLTNLWRAMRRANSDIYYQRTSGSLTGIVSAFCRWHQRKFIFAVASDRNCMTDHPYRQLRHERVLYRYGLRRADLIIAQTVTQQRLLRENFGIDSTVIPNCAPDHERCPGETNAVASARERRLLWIGEFTPIKRLELFLDIAEQLHDLQFDVVGDGNSESEYVQHLRSRAKSMPNVHLHGAVSHAGVHQFYQRSKALISTSRAEGFPNVFLEAWGYGLPIVSTCDPDNVIAQHDLGMVAEDIPGLIAGIRVLFDSQQNWQKASQSALQYRDNHSIESVIPRLENAFLSLAERTEL